MSKLTVLLYGIHRLKITIVSFKQILHSIWYFHWYRGYMCMPFVVKQIVYNSEGTPEFMEAQLCYQNVISML